MREDANLLLPVLAGFLGRGAQISRPSDRSGDLFFGLTRKEEG